MKKPVLHTLSWIIGCILICSCTNTKNTGLTRKIQAFKARYNTYFNGHQAYLEGFKAQEDGNKDNYTEVIPYYMTGNEATRSIGKGNFSTAIAKCQKTIKLHSITKRPEWNKKRKQKPKDKIWLSQREYNPFLYKAWFLMADAQFRQGEFLEAATTYAYIQRQYFSKPNIVAKAKVGEARCYAEMDWFYEAEDLLARARRDSFPIKYQSIAAAVQADCHIRQRQYVDAIPYVEKAIKRVHRGRQKARLYFLLGQLYHIAGEDRKAYKAFTKVISKNPPYELEFNARIQRTEVLSEGRGQQKRMISKLKAMTRNPKNKDYLDQVYYAIGNIYLAQNDTTHAVYSYKDGVEKSTRNGLEKGVVMLHLGQLYWDKEEFVKAHECYSQVIGLLNKDRVDYKEIDRRSKILDGLLPHAQTIELQDSLQRLALMDSVERMDVIKKIIVEVKRKEKEEAKKAAMAENDQASGNRSGGGQQSGGMVTPGGANRQQQGVWYFYNPTAVAAGKQAFEKKWGKRELADDWRRNNKTVLSDFNTPSVDEDAEALADSVGTEGVETKGDGQQGESGDEKDNEEEDYAKDPHRPEYYLKDIPLTDEQMQASNALLMPALFNAAVIYKDEMENFPLAERTFNRILTRFPDFEQMDELYYNLFQLYYRLNRYDEAEQMKQLLVSNYPDNVHGQMISDPNFEFKAKYGKSIEDSLYADAYESYVNDDYHRAIADNETAERDYPNGKNRPLFLYIDAMSRLQLGERDHFMGAMKNIVEKYPQSSVSELAGLFVKGLQEGRLLASGKLDMGSLWDRRMGAAAGDSIGSDTTFKSTRDTEYMFVVAYVRDSLDENQLLYEVANYNFSHFAIRNFDMEFVRGDGIDMLQVKPFRNLDEAYIYWRQLRNDKSMAYKMQGLKTFIISTDNLRLIMHGRSFSDYFKFFDKNLRLKSDAYLDERSLDEPTPIPTPEEQMEEYEEQYGGDDEDFEDEENYIF